MSERSFAVQWAVRGWSTNRIVALYAAIGGLWILLSDRLFIFNAPDQNTAALVSTVKGLSYVLATAWLLYGLINRYTAELRASEERFRIIFEHANDAIHIDTTEDRILDVNPRMCDLMGYSRDELLTMRISDLQAPERRTAGRVVATEQAQHGDALFEGLNLHRDGRRIPVEISVARVARPHGDLYVSVIRDITERKRAEEALRQSQAFSQALIDHSPLGISVRNRTGQLLFANAAWRKVWAISEPDLHADTTRERSSLQFNARDEYLKPYQADLRRVYEQGGYLHLPELKTTRPKPGAAEWISQHFYALTDEQGQVERMVILTEDITARKRRERELEAIAAIATALRTAATRDEMIPAIVGQVHSLLNADGAALIVRDAATGEAVIVHGQGVGADTIGLRIPPGAGIVGQVIATGQPYLTQDAAHDPYVFRPDLNSELHAMVCAPLIAHDRIIGALWAGKRTVINDDEIRVLTAISDIAANALQRAEVLETLEQRVYDRTRELAAANERLQELDRLKSKFVSDVSHELRTPITSLMLNVELLEHGKPEKREHYLSVIRQQTTRQVQLIEDILNLSRLELSATRTQFAPVKVNALIDQAVSVYRSSAEAANLRLTFTPAPAEPVVMGVESHLSQVVTNLIANAIAYTPAGSVEVTTRLVEHEVMIEVRDTGLGIAPEDMPHLFDRFYRGKLTWQVRGSGLGLAIVKEIAEVHKGRVEVDSQAGVGSTFRVYLPLI